MFQSQMLLRRHILCRYTGFQTKNVTNNLLLYLMSCKMPSLALEAHTVMAVPGSHGLFEITLIIQGFLQKKVANFAKGNGTM